VKDATLEQIAELPGFSLKTAQKVRDALGGEPSTVVASATTPDAPSADISTPPSNDT
jgi:hypothetical protein